MDLANVKPQHVEDLETLGIHYIHECRVGKKNDFKQTNIKYPRFNSSNVRLEKKNDS